MSSWFSSAAPRDPSELIHPVQTRYAPAALFGALVPEDLQWLCAGGFVTETQTFYITTATGGLVMCQVIHSSVGVWYPNIQFTFRYVDQAGQINVWKSTTATNFVAAPPTNSGTPLDKRSCKSDQFSITVDPAHPDRYTIVGKYDDEVDVSIVYERLAEGWKLGSGARGGMTYFGDLAASSVEGAQPDLTSGSDGYAVHRFWPRCAVSGILRIGQSVVDLTDARGIFVHAIQGMRPDTLAARWNFANFQSSTVGGQGVSLTMMEFRTTSAYGEALINIGSVVVGDKLVAITSGGSGLASDHGGSSAEHLDSKVDVETEYAAPGKIAYAWQGHSLATDLTSRALPTVAALVLDLELDQTAETYESRGLIEKVDVLGQVPYLIKKFVSYAVGTKPFIYTWLNPVRATITLPVDLDNATSTETKTIEVDGVLFNEATFVS